MAEFLARLRLRGSSFVSRFAIEGHPLCELVSMFLCNGVLGWLGERHCEISERNSHGLNLRLEIIRGFWVVK